MAEHEAELGVKLPAAFLAIAQVRQGATPEPSGIKLPNGVGTGVGGLLHFENDVAIHRNIVSRRFPVEEVLEAGLIPFAEDVGGDLFCFDYRTTPQAPSVAFWSVDWGLMPLAPSFEAFLEMLHED